jgi:Fur family transcriptional regulator, peroxide stress response regulator
MKKIRRKSRQREKIYAIIKNSTEHPTALAIYEALKKVMPKISLGNIYRNINILIEEARIKSSEFGSDIEHYDAMADKHYHFICQKCKKIIDFLLPLQNDIIKNAQQNTKNIIKDHTIQFFGICEDCNKILNIFNKGE